MSAKAGLKAAKTALDNQDYDTAVQQSQTILLSDPQNYFAKLFLGRAFEKLDRLDDAAKTYNSAAAIKPDDAQAWLGLCSVYEPQASKQLDEYRKAAVKAAEILGNAEDTHRCQSIIDKLVDFTKKHGTQSQHKKVLEVLLPGGPIYTLLEGRIQHPCITFIRLAEITESEESQRISKDISERRTRLGARVGQVTLEVKREVYGGSELETLYQNVIDWTNDDDIRRQYEEKLLERAYNMLVVLPLEQKSQKLDMVLKLAEDMVIISHPYQLAWDLVLESRDMDDLRELDVNILQSYIAYFPAAGMAKVLTAWLSSELSPFPEPAKTGDESDMPEPLRPEDRLLLFTESLLSAEQSPFVHRLVCDYYLYLDEHQTVAETSRAGLKATNSESDRLGMTLQNTKDALNTVLATALVHFQAPRHHPEAKRLFEDVLVRKPKLTPALIGLGLILEETEEYQDAIEFFSRALAEDRGNVRVGIELAWCRALSSDYSQAQSELEEMLPLIHADNARTRDLRAQTLYRIGVCIWESDKSKAARKDRNGAYSKFLAAIKANVNFAPAYTSLGFYYGNYAKDKKRARRSFQKAFELSTSEVEAAEHLARSFADQGDWDIVEVIAQRVVDSGRTRPPPGSKKRNISWPYSALGVVQMNKQQYQQAIVSFLAALRLGPDDYESYVGLGESYHNSGRYNSALRTFNYALETHEKMATQISGETWFARYMLANVYRELGEYDDAITGLQNVLNERPAEFGVLMSLLQTYNEHSWRCIDTGLFGQAVQSATNAIAVAVKLAANTPSAFNLWKGIGDACSVFCKVQSSSDTFPQASVQSLLHASKGDGMYDQLSDIDQVSLSSFTVIEGEAPTLLHPFTAAILAYKRAIHSSSHDIHAQSVAWYNLGWIEQAAHIGKGPKSAKRYLNAAVRCFKRAIELEAGNAEFWNALGVVTTLLNPKVAQHSFVRSLHLDELNAKVWANLGALYLIQNDLELARQAFGRAQSTDPSNAHAWVGQGVLSLLVGDQMEALNQFTHAFEISGSASALVKKEYAHSVFDYLLTSESSSNDLTTLIRPIFALQQLSSLRPNDLPYRHLSALFYERVGDYLAAIEVLSELCSAAEADYETSEFLAALGRFAMAKADLARNQLAASLFTAAVENSEISLDLSSDADNSGLSIEERRKLRLSAHLTAGLAQYKLQQTQQSIVMFRDALQESENDADVVCSLVQVLWAQQGSEEKSVAKDQLFDCTEKFPDHVGAVTLLGAIALLDGDNDIATAVQGDLMSLKMKDGLNSADCEGAEALLSALAALTSDGDSEENSLSDAQSTIILDPASQHAWSELQSLSGDPSVAEMTLKIASRAVPPYGEVRPAALAKAFGAVGTPSDAQRAIFLAPWQRDSWSCLNEALDA